MNVFRDFLNSRSQPVPPPNLEGPTISKFPKNQAAKVTLMGYKLPKKSSFQKIIRSPFVASFLLLPIYERLPEIIFSSKVKPQSLIAYDLPFRCICTIVAGYNAVDRPFHCLLDRIGFLAALARRRSSLASIIVPTPMVIAYLGTSSSFSKNRALSLLVNSSSVLMRVRDPREEPGSLKAICPFAPMPKICRSIPPAFSIFSSYHSQNIPHRSPFPGEYARNVCPH